MSATHVTLFHAAPPAAAPAPAVAKLPPLVARHELTEAEEAELKARADADDVEWLEEQAAALAEHIAAVKAKQAPVPAATPAETPAPVPAAE